ncbi:carboxymuconolactone decarboxylase family protein [Lysinimonas soli]|uniref:Carboxymuconolactone decarboxylase family protein n=1 Tax=Lysinimonas soli TaxID=1074233 RepID=A0ABW0NKH8_9MICO
MSAFIAPPRRIPFLLRIGLWISRRVTGDDLLPPRLLTWYPRAAIGIGVVESLVAHDEGRVDARMLQFVRMAVSFAVECPFCMGFNSRDWQKRMTEQELPGVQGLTPLEQIPSFSPRERLAIEYARRVSETPLRFTPEFGARLTELFTEREIVILATTAAQVNLWARTIQALGCPPQG